MAYNIYITDDISEGASELTSDKIGVVALQNGHHGPLHIKKIKQTSTKQFRLGQSYKDIVISMAGIQSRLPVGVQANYPSRESVDFTYIGDGNKIGWTHWGSFYS